MKKLDGEGGVRKHDSYVVRKRNNSQKISAEKRLSCPLSPLMSRYNHKHN